VQPDFGLIDDRIVVAGPIGPSMRACEFVGWVERGESRQRTMPRGKAQDGPLRPARPTPCPEMRHRLAARTRKVTVMAFRSEADITAAKAQAAPQGFAASS
jgi:hypothetical protein